MAKKGKLTRNTKGQFVRGNSGNPSGRPLGSKNKVTLMKVMTEERFRGEADEKINKVLHMVLDQALEGSPTAQKLIWDSAMSKQNISEDKSAGSKQQITIHRMEVAKDGDIIDLKSEVNDEQTTSNGSVSPH